MTAEQLSLVNTAPPRRRRDLEPPSPSQLAGTDPEPSRPEWTDEIEDLVCRIDRRHAPISGGEACSCGWRCPPRHGHVVMHSMHRARAILTALAENGALRNATEQQAQHDKAVAVLARLARLRSLSDGARALLLRHADMLRWRIGEYR